MEITQLLFLLKWVTLSAAISLFVFKYWYLAQVMRSKTTQPKLVWLGWYQSQDLTKINCPRQWENMQKNNRITTAMWICVIISSALFLSVPQ